MSCAYSVYVLLNPEGDIYIGQTGNLPLRLCEHNDPSFRGTLYTSATRVPVAACAPRGVADARGSDAA